MKTENRQISSVNGRSTKKKNAGYHSCVNPLFEVQGSTFIYYNESPFIACLKRTKFSFVRFMRVMSAFSFSINLGVFFRKNGRRYIRTTHHQLILDF